MNQVNAAKGRGGQSAAAKKFGVSLLTIGSWLKAAGKSARPKAAKKAAAKPTGRGKVLEQLAALDQEIAKRRKELEALEAKFQKLKGNL